MKRLSTRTKHIADFKTVMAAVKQGLSITEACKLSKINRGTLYHNMDQKEKKILDAARIIANPVQHLTGLRGIPFFLEREYLSIN